MRRPKRQDIGWKPIETLPLPLTAAETRTVWLLPRDRRLLPREWVLARGVPTAQFSHWRDKGRHLGCFRIGRVKASDAKVLQ